MGVLGISLAAPIAAATAAPVFAVAFYRVAMGTAATAPVAFVGHRAELRGLPRRVLAGSLLAGALLAVHFALWIPSLRLTSITASTALVATTPIWTVALERLRGVRAGPGVLAGVALAVVGVLVVTGVDAGRSGRALAGDVLAVAGGMASAGYVLVGEGVRRSASTAAYTLLAYGSCALLLLPLCLVTGQRLLGYDARTWVELAVLAICAQILGHTMLNMALPVVGATPLSLAILLEVPGAALVAWVWLNQVPPLSVVPGVAAVLGGLVLVVRSRSRGPRHLAPD